MLHIIRAAVASGFCLLACGGARAAPASALPLAALDPPATIPVVVFGQEARLTVQQFAERHHLNAGLVQHAHAASGVIHCGRARGAGQLTLADNVVTTAAHVLFNEQGQPRGDSGHCLFTATIGQEEVTTAIDMSSVVAGERAPYSAPAVHDWAVARLLRPIHGVTPYSLGPHAHAREPIEFVARGHSDWGEGRAMSMEDCWMRGLLSTGAEGTREFSFDCDAGVGASGGALLSAHGGRLLAVFVGYRSVAPDQALPFSAQHYNFAVSVDGAFRRAVETEAASTALSSR